MTQNTRMVNSLQLDEGTDVVQVANYSEIGLRKMPTQPPKSPDELGWKK
jgi:hypothetical protein